jgi:hypothetical protein
MHTITTYGGSWIEGNESLSYTYDTMNPRVSKEDDPKTKPELPNEPPEEPQRPVPSEVPAEKPTKHPDEPSDNKYKSKFVGAAKRLIDKGYNWKDLHNVLHRRLKREESLIKSGKCTPNQAAAKFKLLGNPTSFAILSVLHKKNSTIMEIAAAINKTRENVSASTRNLRITGIVSCKWVEGKKVYSLTSTGWLMAEAAALLVA